MSMRGQIWTGKIAFCALVLSVQPSAATYSKIQIWMQQAAVLLIFAGSDWSHVPKTRYGRSRWCNRHRIDQNGSASNIPTPVCRIFFGVCMIALRLAACFYHFQSNFSKTCKFLCFVGIEFCTATLQYLFHTLVKPIPSFPYLSFFWSCKIYSVEDLLHSIPETLPRDNGSQWHATH